jgi:hypothetical protein
MEEMDEMANRSLPFVPGRQPNITADSRQHGHRVKGYETTICSSVTTRCDSRQFGSLISQAVIAYVKSQVSHI